MDHTESLCHAMDLANYAVWRCIGRNRPTTNLQLQKMLYFLQAGYCCATCGGLLFPEEFNAWKYGPVIVEVYRAYENFRGLPIYTSDPAGNPAPPYWQSFVDSGIDYLRSKSPWQLVEISHRSGSPWYKVFNDGTRPYGRISNDMIVEYYGNLQSLEV